MFITIFLQEVIFERFSAFVSFALNPTEKI